MDLTNLSAYAFRSKILISLALYPSVARPCPEKCPHLSAVRGLRCEVRCYLRAEANECIRRFPNVELTGVSGIYGRSRTVVDLGVGSSSRTHPKVCLETLHDPTRYPAMIGMQVCYQYPQNRMLRTLRDSPKRLFPRGRDACRPAAR